MKKTHHQGRGMIFNRFYTYIKKHVSTTGILFILAGLLIGCANTSASIEEKREGKHIHFLCNFATNSLDPHVDSSCYLINNRCLVICGGTNRVLIQSILSAERFYFIPYFCLWYFGTNNDHLSCATCFCKLLSKCFLLSKTTRLLSNWGAWISPLIGPICLWVAYKIFMNCVNRYQDAGG